MDRSAHALALAVVLLTASASNVVHAQDETPSRCDALAAEAARLKEGIRGATARRAGGFLAGIASRSLAYAPSVDVGDSVLARASGQAVEGAAHDAAQGQLQAARQSGQTFDVAGARTRLAAIDREAAGLDCPKG